MCSPSIINKSNVIFNKADNTKPKQNNIETKNTQIVKKTEINTNDQINITTKTIIISSDEIQEPTNKSVSSAISQGLKNKEKANEISPKGATDYSQAETDKIISAAEKHGQELFPKDSFAAADSAWAWSLEKRNKDPKDVNWAAAEHYLYAKSRSKESKVEGVTMGVLAAGYDIVKAGLFVIDKQELLSTTGKKDDISKPTLGSTLSGIKGAIDGF
jgi:hypothetical protein